LEEIPPIIYGVVCEELVVPLSYFFSKEIINKMSILFKKKFKVTSEDPVLLLLIFPLFAWNCFVFIFSSYAFFISSKQTNKNLRMIIIYCMRKALTSSSFFLFLEK
jgi:hypothetical protein